MPICYLALGSNLKNPKRQLNQALLALRKLPQSAIKRCSTPYKNPPMGVKAQPLFYNMVIALQTTLAPQTLLNHCQRIEKQQNRLRKKHWGARTIDIDIVFYGDKIIRTKNLTLPHPEWLKRDFVLIPLLEVLGRIDNCSPPPKCLGLPLSIDHILCNS